MTELQKRVLAELSAQSAKCDFIKEIYVFGSVARGEESPDDIDICFEYDETWAMHSAPLDTSFEEWEAALRDWAASLSLTLGLRVELHDLRDQSDADASIKHVLENRKCPLAIVGKAMLVYTPKVKKSPRSLDHAPRL